MKKCICILLLISLVAGCKPTSAPALDTINLPPNPAAVNINPRGCAEDEYSASNERIGVMKSTNGGESWKFLGHACFHTPELAPVDIDPILIDGSLSLYFVDFMSFASGMIRTAYRAFTSDGVLFSQPVPVYTSTTEQFTDPYVLRMNNGDLIMYMSDVGGIRVTVSKDQGATFTSIGMVSIGLSVPGALLLPDGRVRLFGGTQAPGLDIFAANSPDGLSNFILDTLPTIKRDSADMVSDAHPIPLRRGGYLMAYKVRPSGAGDDPVKDLVYLARSEDGHRWMPGASSIVKGSVPSILELPDGTLLLYYVDFNY